MSLTTRFLLLFTTLSTLTTNIVFSAPTEKEESSQFKEIYDQRQNGTENYRLDIKDVVVVWSPPGGLLQAAALLDPALFDSDYELEDFFKPDNSNQNSEKPQDLVIVNNTKPENVSTTTLKTPVVSLGEGGGNENKPAVQISHGKRRLRIPGFIRPFLRQQ